MKTFDDLKFEPYSASNCKRAEIWFDNNYGVSVLLGKMFYSNGVDTYEIAVLCRECVGGVDMIEVPQGWQTKDDVTRIMREVQERV